MSNELSLGVAVVGLGVGEQHVQAFHAHPRCRIRWLYDLDTAKAEGLVAKLGEGAVAPDFETVLNSPQVQIVSIASYDDDHAEQVVKALQAGKHVFVEKPLCQTREQLRAIQQAWASHGGRLKLVSNLVLRAAPLYIWLKSKLQAGDFGEVYAFEGAYLYGRLSKITQGWRKNVENYSVMQGGGIHLIDLLTWLTGQRPTAVSAVGNRLSTAGTDFRYDDFVTAIMQTPSGMIGQITANFGCVHRHQHVVRIFGTRATFLYDDAGPRLHATRDPAVAASSVALSPLPKGKGDLIPDFVSAILRQVDHSAETQSAFDGLSISLACDRALATHALEAVDYV